MNTTEKYLNNIVASLGGDANKVELPKTPNTKVAAYLDYIVRLIENGSSADINKQVAEIVAGIVANAPEDFDTLKEISDWIYYHEDSAAAMNSAIVANTAVIVQKADKSTTYTKTEVNTALDGKVNKVLGKGLSTNDFTNDDKSKLDGLESYDDTQIKAEIDAISNQIFGLGEKIPANADLNNYTNTGIYYSASASNSKTLENTPYTTGGFRFEVSRISSINGFMQRIYPNSSTLGCFFIRVFVDGAFGLWFKYSGEALMT